MAFDNGTCKALGLLCRPIDACIMDYQRWKSFFLVLVFTYPVITEK